MPLGTFTAMGAFFFLSAATAGATKATVSKQADIIVIVFFIIISAGSLSSGERVRLKKVRSLFKAYSQIFAALIKRATRLMIYIYERGIMV